MGCVPSSNTLTRSLPGTGNEFQEKLRDTVPVIPHENASFSAYCSRVIDGDTIVIKFFEGFCNEFNRRVVEEHVRLAHINAPEIHTRDLDEKARGMASKAALEQLVLGQMLVIHSIKREKFGRLLCDVFRLNTGVYVNIYMVANHYAVEYEGGTR